MHLRSLLQTLSAGFLSLGLVGLVLSVLTGYFSAGPAVALCGLGLAGVIALFFEPRRR
jgi:hypothetical protein